VFGWFFRTTRNEHQKNKYRNDIPRYQYTRKISIFITHTLTTHKSINGLLSCSTQKPYEYCSALYMQNVRNTLSKTSVPSEYYLMDLHWLVWKSVSLSKHFPFTQLPILPCAHSALFHLLPTYHITIKLFTICMLSYKDILPMSL